MDDAVEAPEDLAIGVLAVGPVEELEGHDLSRGRDVAVVPEGPGGGRCGGRRDSGWGCRRHRRRTQDTGVDSELPERVAVDRVADRAVHSDIAPGAAHGQVLDATCAGCRGIDRGPVL